MPKSIRSLALLVLFICPTQAQQIHPARLRTVVGIEAVAFAGGLYGLGKAWYKTPKSKFHTFNDGHEWLKIDKLGHSYWSYQMARFSLGAYEWTGMSQNRAASYSALNGFMFQAPIEIMDGFSPDYGFSVGDVSANLVGAVFFAGQQWAWGEARVLPKWSWHPTPFAKERPELLGRDWSEQWLKDYNGQTYWFSTNIAAFAPENTRIPRMLNVAVGYSVSNMIAADPEKSIRLGRKPFRQFFFSPDLDLTRIRTDSQFLQGLLFLANCLKVPAPALEVQIRPEKPKLKVKFHALYF